MAVPAIRRIGANILGFVLDESQDDFDHIFPVYRISSYLSR